VERLANLLHAPSYVSLERALSLHGLIPESVPVCTSITTNRPIRLDTPLCRFAYQHVKPGWFFGFQERPLGESRALVAVPEKALLDLLYLARGEFTAERIDALRLQNTDVLNKETLLAMSQKARPRVARAARRIVRWLEEQRVGFEQL
jgi:hypothetical protein